MKRGWCLEMKALKTVWDSFLGQLPTAYLSGLPDIRVTAMRDVYIEAHQGLLAYSEEEILVKASDRTISVIGNGLILRGITAEEVHISGSIRDVRSVD